MSLQSCIFVAGACAGGAAIAVVYDHRNINTALDDMHIANKVLEKIRFNPYLYQDSHIEVSVFNHVVLLTGETPDQSWRQEAGDLAKSVPNVVRVYNQISIQSPTSALTRTSDTWITAKIKAQMLTTENLKTSSIKVVSENGITYLMGRVSHEQAELAVDIARRASGVQKVIKVFQYID